MWPLRYSCLLAMAAMLSLGLTTPSQATREVADACTRHGIWLDPKTGAGLATPDLMKRVATPGIVLLGETHTSAADHRWQLHTLAGLLAHYGFLKVGFEMFPRRVQPVLDAWSRGDYRQDAAFLAAVEWETVWGYDAGLYLPLLHFARQNRLEVVALNVERGLVSRVGAEGWAAIPPNEREGVSDSAPASAAYRRSLAEVYRNKQAHGADLQDGAEPADIQEIVESADFDRFVEAQLTWDRAMAEALATARRRHPRSLVVGIIGRGHLEHGYGVPHQLAALGEQRVSVLLPVEVGADCEALEPEIADAVFLLAPDEKATAPRQP